MRVRLRLVLLVAIMLTYALCYAAIKAGLTWAPPLGFAAWRAFIAGIVLLGILLVRRERIIPAHTDWPAILLLGFFATTLTFGAMFLSPGRTSAGIASVLGNMQALITLALAAIFLGEAVTRGKMIALALGLLGVTLITYPALTATDAYGISGAVLALGASFAAATANVLGKTMRLGQHVLAVTGWQLLFGSMPLFALSAFVERDVTIQWTPTFIGLLLFLALPGTAFAVAAWYWLLQSDDVSRLSLYFFLVPAMGVGLALLLGESLSLLEIGGAALIVASAGAVYTSDSDPRAPAL